MKKQEQSDEDKSSKKEDKELEAVESNKSISKGNFVEASIEQALKIRYLEQKISHLEEDNKQKEVALVE